MLQPTNLLGLGREALSDFLHHMAEKPYRTQQLMYWLYQQDVLDFGQMTNLSKTLRARLQATACLDIPKVSQILKAQDGTIKWLLELAGNNAIEMVYIPEKQRGTLCISSQVGCALACTFCSTAQQGFNRNLTAAEMIAQVGIAQQHLRQSNQQITNVVFMGMGEPLLNENAVFTVAGLLLDDWAYGLSRRKVTISTSGVVPAIRRLSDSLPVSLAISLHAANDALRNQLVPINQKYPIAELMAACRYYLAQGGQKRHILFEYVMLKGVNDSDKDANELIKLVGNVSAKVNLIPFNDYPNSIYQCSSTRRIRDFQDKLHASGIRTTIRRTRGEDIVAACGQLAGEVNDKTKRHLQ